MTAAAPWSVKGIDPKAREIAKDLARRSGMTLGEWLNSMIMDEPDEDEDGVATLPRRSPIPDPYDRRSRARRLDDAYGEPDMGRMGASLEVIAERLEATERRSTVAIQGIDQAVAGLVRRLEAQDTADAAQARRIDDIAEEMREGRRRLRRLEQGADTREGLDKLDGALTAISTRLYELDERQRAGVSDLRDRIEAIEKNVGAGVGMDRLAQVGQRLDEAQARTSEALHGLERSFAALDQRLREAEGRLQPDPHSEASRFEQLAERLTRQVETSRVELMRRLDTIETEGRVERIERALAAIGDQARAAERRSAAAVEGMGREILRIAQNLNGRVEKVEAGGAGDARLVALEQKLERDLARHAEAMDQRLTRADDQHALALERLGGEITRISDRLSERIAQSERRSAQALDDIGRRLSESTEKIQQRQERASGDLAERMRQSEERTARLLAEARDSMEQRGDRAARRLPPLDELDVAPWTPAESAGGDWRAAAFADPVESWSSDVLGDVDGAGALAVEPFSSRITVREGDFIDPLDADLLEGEGLTMGAPFGRFAAEASSPATTTPMVAETDEDLFGGADVSDILAAVATVEAQAGAAPAPEVDDLTPVADDDGFSAELDFIASGVEAAADGASTRDVLEAARAAMALEGEGTSRPAFGLAKRGGKSKLQERLDRQANRQGSTMRKALGAMAVAAVGVVGGYASLQVAGDAGLTLPGGFALAPEAKEAAPVEAAAPIAALALDGAPTDAVPSPDVAATEGAALFASAVQMLDNGDDGGLEPLTRAANLGYAPAQLRLAVLYQDGEAGLAVDEAEARAWARRAAEGGEPKAMHHYAMQLYEGRGGAKSRAEALAWLKKAAVAGRVDSQYNVAKMLEQGDEGVAANRSEAFKWYMIAARRGDQPALVAVQRLTPDLSAVERRKAREAADAFTAPPLA